MKNINDSIDTLHVTLYKIQINVWTCRDCHRHCTTFFSLKPKIDNPFLIPFKCKFHINGAFFYIEVLGLICSLQRTLDQGTSTLKVMEIECQITYLWGSIPVYVVKIGNQLLSLIIDGLYMDSKWHQLQYYQSSCVENMKKKSQTFVSQCHTFRFILESPHCVYY